MQLFLPPFPLPTATPFLVRLDFSGPWRPPWIPEGRSVTVALPAPPAPPPAAAGTVETLARFVLPDGSQCPAVWRGDRARGFGFHPAAALDFLRLERYTRRPRPVTRFLPFHYHAVPAPLRLGIRRLLQWAASGRGRPSFPAWPEETAADVLAWLERRARAEAGAPPAPVPPWPAGKRFALVLTHDVDTGAGFGLIDGLRALEERHALRSTWNVVADHYPLDDGRLRDLAAAGHEIGSHGDNHDNRIAFAGPEDIRRRLEVCRPLVERHGVKGFRSPSLLRTDALFAELPRLFRYDASAPDTYEGSGCCTVFPFRIGELWELPLTVPEDALLLFQRLDVDARVALWVAKIESIRAVGGVAVVNTHPDPQFSGNAEGVEAYRRLVERIAGWPDAWVATAGEVVEYWARGSFSRSPG